MKDQFGGLHGQIINMVILLELDHLGIRLPFSRKSMVLGRKLHIINFIVLQLIGLSLHSLDSNYMLAPVTA